MADSEENRDRFDEFNRRRGVERRGDVERRASQESWNKPERRSGLERRSGDDRRDLLYGLIHSTTGNLDDVRDWLERNCEGKWNLESVAVDDSLAIKTLRIMFELELDKTNFHTWAKNR